MNKRSLLSLLGLSALLASQPKPDARGYIVKVGDPCPDVSIQLADGTQVQTGDLKGQVFLLQFTASWCSVCRKEMPHLESEVWEKYHPKGLVMIGVDRDEPLDTVTKFAKEMKITYPLGMDPEANIFAKFADKEAGVTRNVLVDRNGKIVFLTRLYDLDEFKSMVAIIDELLNQ